MNPRTMSAIVLQDARLLRKDAGSVLTLTVTAIALVAFLRPATGLIVPADFNGDGARQAVPGMAVMFSMFLIGTTGFSLFREHGWNTWNRVRTMTSPTELVVSKAIVPLLTALANVLVVLAVGDIVFGLDIGAAWPAVFAVAVLFAVALVAISFAVAAACRSVIQVSTVSSLSGIALAGLGGALLPRAAMPEWAAEVAPATPTYWAMRGFDSALAGRGLGQAIKVALPLLLFAVAGCGFASRRFKLDETKVSFQ